MACEKEEHLVNKNNEQLPQNPKDMVQNKFIFQWDTLIDDSKNDDEFFIGNQYIGVQRWECLYTRTGQNFHLLSKSSPYAWPDTKLLKQRPYRPDYKKHRPLRKTITVFLQYLVQKS